MRTIINCMRELQYDEVLVIAFHNTAAEFKFSEKEPETLGEALELGFNRDKRIWKNIMKALPQILEQCNCHSNDYERVYDSLKIVNKNKQYIINEGNILVIDEDVNIHTA